LRDKLDEAEMRLAKMDLLAFQRLQNDIQRLKGLVPSLEREVFDLKVKVEAKQISLEEINSLEEETQELRERLAVAQERQQVLSLARQVLNEAREATMVSATDVLQSEIGDIISEITDGRYREVRVDPARLSIELVSPDSGGPVAVELGRDLSTGTVEQVYLAARIALTRLLSQGKRPPLILDDPFLSFDLARTNAVLGLCKRLSEDTQVLLFTCREGYESLADNLVRLPGL